MTTAPPAQTAPCPCQTQALLLSAFLLRNSPNPSFHLDTDTTKPPPLPQTAFLSSTLIKLPPANTRLRASDPQYRQRWVPVLCCKPAPFLTVSLPSPLAHTSHSLGAGQALCEKSGTPPSPSTATASVLAFTSRHGHPHNTPSHSCLASTAQSIPPPATKTTLTRALSGHREDLARLAADSTR